MMPTTTHRTLSAVLPLFLSAAAAAGCATTTAAPNPDPVPPPTLTAEVVKIVDGDTIDVRDDERGRLRIRILGIDTPEVARPGYTVGCWGPEASAFARDVLGGQRVSIVLDPSQDSHDRYGRTLAYLVLADGRNYSVEAARAGAAHAYVYDRPVQMSDEISAAEEDARAAGRGLWGPPCNGATESTPR